MLCAGVCEDGGGQVGCGPQEEFRACSDVSVTEEDGTADSVPNNDIDIVIDEIDDNSLDWGQDSEQHFVPGPEIILYEGDNGERVAVIVLASLLTSVLLFGGIFLYYYKVRDVLSQSPCPLSLPAKFKLKPPKLKLPRLKSLPESFCKLDKLSRPSWPLSSVSVSSREVHSWLPSLVSRHKTRPTSPSHSAPVAPPRTRRGRSRCASPDPQQTVKIPKSVLDISGPTEVTINGVTVGQSGQSVMGKTLGPTPTSRGVICDNMAPARTIWAAHPVTVMEDQPDSSLDIPPPLPDCPPPQDSLVLSLDTQNTDTEA